MDENDRRARIMAERIAETGIDEAMLERLVRTFYARIRQHAVLGPIFNQRIPDWEHHMQRLIAFWSSVALASGAYSGSPMQKHLELPVDGRHFDLWLDLFVKTAGETCPPAAAKFLIARARRIAESLELAIAVQNKVMLNKDERLRRPDADVFLPATAT
jgi:hemoglobin